MLTLGDGLHPGGIFLFEALTMHSVGFGALLHGKGIIEESTCIVDGGFLGNKVGDNLVELLDHFNLDHTGFALSLSRTSASAITESRLALLSKGQCILAHVSQVIY